MERKKIPFSAKIKFVEKINEEFLKCKVYVCALGKNRNFSYISMEAADAALYSLYNIPVIGNLYEDENGNLHMGGHDMAVKQDANGAYIMKSICVPYGVVPKQDNVHYEDLKEPNGDVKTYIVADCILWVGRFPELAEAAYSEDWMFSQSMEINVNDYTPLDEDKNYTNILDYSYSALCLLGKSDDKDYNVEPCFPEAKVSVAYDLDNDRFAMLMEELRKDLSKVFSAKDDGKEEKTKMTHETDKTTAVMTESTLEEQNADIATAEETDNTTRSALDNMEEPEENADNTANEPSQSDSGEVSESKYAFTYREKAEAISNAIPCSEDVSYWLCDFDDKYAYVERCVRDNGNYSEEKGRFEYAYDEAAKTASVTGEFEKMIVRWITPEEDQAINVMRGQYEELLAYKAQREDSDRRKELDDAVEQFSDLTGNEEFDAIMANRYSYESVDAIKNACYIVRGKYGLVSKPRKAEPSVPVGGSHETPTLRDKFHEVYGRR